MIQESQSWDDISEEPKWTSVKPGITGYSQIKYRDEENLLHGESLENEYRLILKDKLETDINYIKNKSFWEDFRILFNTVRVLLH
jgi:lipopolysaccharide/colanic/teichoic acid biosynthesis glycosyltransferase